MRVHSQTCSALVALVLSGLWAVPLHAERRRAVLVGINIYTPKASTRIAGSAEPSGGRLEWSDLDGAVNDVEVMRELLEARFRFRPENIVVLENSQATRSRIMAAIQEHLVDGPSAGDVAFFYFSGHGSRVTNSLNGEDKRKDETIVPADANLGVWDIRDKELARLFNKALDKGVILTAVFDSCHSGSIVRGWPPTNAGKARWLADDPRDVCTPPDPGRPPEARTDLKERGILVLSAAQDYEAALEATDAEAPVPEREPRGAFSLALTRVLRTAPEDESASRVFDEVTTYLMAENYAQVPVLSGTAERRAAPLFGTGGAASDLRVAVLKVEGSVVELRGGYAIGLTAGCELRGEPPEGPIPIRIRVTEVKNLDRSLATVFEGAATAIRPGVSLFKVDRWAYSDVESSLSLWWPNKPLRFQEIESVRGEINSLRNSGKVSWVTDPTVDSPSWLVRHDAASWSLLEVASRKTSSLGRTLRAEAVLSAIRPDGHGLPKVFVEVPPPAELVAMLRLGSGTPNDAITLAASQRAASYALVGRLEGDDVQVAWVMPYATADRAENPMPVRSDWKAVKHSPDSLRGVAATLEDTVQRLQRIKGWLRLRSMGESTPFPYHLAFRNTKTGEVSESGPLLKGETYNVVLVRDKLPPRAVAVRRRVYVFAIDSWGRGTLLYPLYGDVENLLPRAQELENGPDIVLRANTRPFTIEEPLGFDAYFLLTSERPLGDPSSILSFEGVRTRGAQPAPSPSDPLARLLLRVGSSTRSATPVAPADWSIQPIIVRSVAAR